MEVLGGRGAGMSGTDASNKKGPSPRGDLLAKAPKTGCRADLQKFRVQKFPAGENRKYSQRP